MRTLTIAFILLLTGTALWAQDAAIVATAYQTVNVRNGPGTQYEIIGQLRDGDIVPVLGRATAASRWLHVSLADDSGEGWVAVFTVTLNADPETLPIVDMAAESTPAPTADGVHITAFGRVNMRNGPGITFDIINELEAEDTAQVTARSNYNNDWLYIESSAGAGWIAYFTVTVSGNPDDLPVLVPDEASGELVPPSALISANYRVQIHTRPAFSSPVIGLVPFTAEVVPQAISTNGRWLHITTPEAEGWVLAALFDITDEQEALIPRQNTTPATPTPINSDN